MTKLVAIGALLSGASGACANVTSPLVRVMTGSRYTPWETAALSLGVVVVFGYVQARIFRLFDKGRSTLACTVLFALLTFLLPCSFITLPNLWPALIEACFWLLFAEFALLASVQFAGKRSIGWYVLVTLAMNLGSGCLLAAVLAAMVHLPANGANDAEMTSHLRGKLAICGGFKTSVVDLAGEDRVPKDLRYVNTDLGANAEALADGRIAWISRGAAWTAWPTGNAINEPLELPKEVSEVSAVSDGGRLVFGKVRGRKCVYDAVARRALRLPSEVADLTNARFSRSADVMVGTDDSGTMLLVNLPSATVQRIGVARRGSAPSISADGRHIAWIGDDMDPKTSARTPISLHHRDRKITVYDCKSSTKRVLHTQDDPLGGLAWSPDSAYLAYLGNGPNQFAQRLLPIFLRVISADGRRSASVCQCDLIGTQYIQLVWTH